MSLLPGLTQSAPGVPIFASASGGGGGGGGPNLVVSTLTAADSISCNGDISVNGMSAVAFPTGVVGSEATLSINNITGYVNPIAGEGSLLLSTEYQTNAGIVYGPLGVGSLEVIGITSGGVVPGVRVTSDAAGSLVLQAPSSIQCQAVSSINFSTPSLLLNGSPVGGGALNPNPQFSTLTCAGQALLAGGINMSNTLLQLSQGSNNAGVLYYNSGDSNIYLTAPSTGVVAIGTQSNATALQVGNNFVSIPNVGASISSLTVSSLNGAAPGGSVPNLTLSTLNLNGGANQLNLISDNTATAKIWATGGSGLELSTVTTFNNGALFVSPTSLSDTRGWFQSGYVQDFPYASTVLFAYPYSNDNICVQLTPTIRNTSGGANPQCSLGVAFGANGNGVSSIGFQVDMRNGGSGYTGSFFYTAFPL
jgi:hypothetical protein